MNSQFGYSEEPENKPLATPPAEPEPRSFFRAFKSDAPPFLFAGALVVGAAALYERLTGKKGRKRIVRRLVKR